MGEAKRRLILGRNGKPVPVSTTVDVVDTEPDDVATKPEIRYYDIKHVPMVQIEACPRKGCATTGFMTPDPKAVAHARSGKDFDTQQCSCGTLFVARKRMIVTQ
ncbi:MAG: hypothetical protein ACYSW8_28055 [Planctomycetota bacterium]|jgi:hypothetical protein